jgi:hypothetical protein
MMPAAIMIIMVIVIAGYLAARNNPRKNRMKYYKKLKAWREKNEKKK